MTQNATEQAARFYVKPSPTQRGSWNVHDRDNQSSYAVLVSKDRTEFNTCKGDAASLRTARAAGWDVLRMLSGEN